MKIHKQGLFFILLLLSCIGCSKKQSLEWIPFNWEGDTISGKYIEKAFIYIPVKVAGLPSDFTMQFDLGTGRSMFYGNSIEPYLAEFTPFANTLDSTSGLFRDICLKMGRVEFKEIDIEYRKNFGEITPRDSIHSKTPKHIGTIAPDIFRNKILMIDYKLNRLAVSDSLPDEYKDLPAEKFELEGGIMKLPFRINGKDCKLLFDTGSSPFQLVTSKERALEISDSMITDSLSGPLWWGTEITFYGLDINKPVEFGGKVLKNSKVYYEKNKLWDGIYKSFNVWGITGNAYFFDNTVIIDYKNKLFRVK